MTKKMTQAQKLKNHFAKGKSITGKSALSLYKVKNLRARIADLRSEGLNIVDRPASKNSTVKRYSLA